MPRRRRPRGTGSWGDEAMKLRLCHHEVHESRHRHALHQEKGPLMSMICGLVGLSSLQIVALRQAPALANDLARVAEADSAKNETLDGYKSRMTPEPRARFEAMNKQAEA